MKTETEIRHHKEGVVRTALLCGNVALVGPSGSGKTTLARNIASDLGLDFYFTGAVLSEHKLTGFIDARGKVVRTPFRDAFEKGGVFLFDEVDASAPAAILALNAALSNGQMDFPDACIEAHKDFKVIAASNTFWTGADRTYVGRNQLDGATLDRFIMVTLDYDEDMERKLAGSDMWTDFVQKARAAVKDLEIRHVVSPRAAILGAKLLSEGLSLEEVKQMTVWKGLTSEVITKIEGAMNPKDERGDQPAQDMPNITAQDMMDQLGIKDMSELYERLRRSGDRPFFDDGIREYIPPRFDWKEAQRIQPFKKRGKK